MRVALTVLDPTSGARADVLVAVDAAATVREVARAIAGAPAPRGARGPDRAGVTGAATDAPDDRLAIVIRHPRFTQQAADDRWEPAPAAPAAAPEAVSTLWVDGRPLAAELPAARVLRDGMVVSLSPRYAPATDLAEPDGVAEIRVVGGPAAGSVHRLGLGRFEIGGDPRCAVAVDDPAVPPRAALVSVGPAGASVEPAPGAGVALDGERLGGPAGWTWGGFRVSMLCLLIQVWK